LLVEPAATNLLFRSEEFDDAYWTKTNLNTTATPPWVNVATAPDGTMTAEKLIANTANSTHLITRTGLTSGSYTFSVFAKAGEETILSLWLVNNTIRGQFDLSNGTIQFSSAGVSSKIEPYGNGWYRCSVYSSVATTTASIYMRTGGSFAGDNTSGFFIWGAQLETGSVATSYIPTTTAAVSRSADVVSLSGATDYIGQTEGAIYVEVDVRNFVNFSRVISLSDGTSSNSIGLQLFLNGAVKSLRVGLSFLGSGQVDIIVPMIDTINKIAVGYKQNDFVVCLNGSIVGTDTSCSVPVMNSVGLGNINGVNIIGDRIRAAAIYKTRLPNYLLESATSQIQSYSALASSLSYSIV
jgi:hypothetical protein